MAREQREFDVIVWGATGFTGRLVCAYLQQHAGKVKWAAAARNPQKLAETCAALAGKGGAIAQLCADSNDLAAMRALSKRTRVVITTVGPYAWYGANLVQACAENGTDYCDLAGEVQWIRDMILQWDDTAKKSGARLLHCCGFDSVPFDMGVWYLQQQMHQRHDVYCGEINGVVRKMRGAFSGGTYASMLNFVKEAAADPALRRIAANPNALLPPTAIKPRRQPARPGVSFNEDLGVWTAPFVMAAINTRIVRRSNALLGSPWDSDFRYEETMATGRGFAGRARAVAVQLGLGAFMASAAFAPTRALLSKLMPAVGEGPDEQARAAGFYEIDFVGHHPQDRDKRIVLRVRGDMDPGYGSTSKMISECALSLAQDDLDTPGGSWTPSAALGDALLVRLRSRAGLSFVLRDPDAD